MSGRSASTILRLRSGFRQRARTPATRLNFNVWTERKRIEKLRYIHRNPVKRGLVTEPDQWKWSSFRSYLYGEPGLVRVNFQEWSLEAKRRPPVRWGEVDCNALPLIRKVRE